MDFKVIEDIEKRFKDTNFIFVAKTEWMDLSEIIAKLMTSNNELVRSIFDVLSYRLGVEFDEFLLNRISHSILDKNGNKKEVIPLVLTLKHKGKSVLIMDGGFTGNTLYDLSLLYDKLVNMNILAGATYTPVEFSVVSPMDTKIC